ncbi:MAG TPA: response regulator [Candidatus Binatia bacterium]|nr:response regulator [Candidatus Binatia bacterium]
MDDEFAVRCSVRWQLEGAGYAVLEAPDGRGVVETVERQGIALVVTDILMPNHEGMETIQDLRRACPGVPVIAISARGQQYLDAARALGAAYTFAKPFESALFVQTVEKLLSPPRAA